MVAFYKPVVLHVLLHLSPALLLVFPCLQVYYWHTVTNQVQYEQPEGFDYVPAVMPKQQKDET